MFILNNVEVNINNLLESRILPLNKIIWNVYTFFIKTDKYKVFNDNFFNITNIELKATCITYTINLYLAPTNKSLITIPFYVTGYIVGATCNKKYLKLSNIKVQFL
ncbi:hypothetical protein [Clostridium butyricum]|uniref:hypothetical protein n=1 Tax=Clostridium butyricum TaxID=1492 RepID=UPI002AB2078F|nr:hypothetical protein [Clostridium butyricum]